MNIQDMTSRSLLCVLGLLGLTLFASPVAGQVFNSGLSNPNDFFTVVNVPTTPSFGDSTSFTTSNGDTTQVNLFAGGSVGNLSEINLGVELNVRGGSLGSGFDANSGSELNIRGGIVGEQLAALPGSQINISGGSVGDSFFIQLDSEVNISGGTVGFIVAFADSVLNISGGSIGRGSVSADLFATSDSEVNISGGNIGTVSGGVGAEVNLFGSDFVLDGVSLDSSVALGSALTIVDRDVTLSGLLDDGSPFSFDLNSTIIDGEDRFDPSATLTVTLGPQFILGDCDLNREVNFADIAPFIQILQDGTFLHQADCNQDGEVTFADITSFIAILQAS